MVGTEVGTGYCPDKYLALSLLVLDCSEAFAHALKESNASECLVCIYFGSMTELRSHFSKLNSLLSRF